MKRVFDIDNTICVTIGNDYPNAKVIQERIEQINQLYNEGCQIVIKTGRGSKSGKDWRELTTQQLKDWGLKYHELIFENDKPDMIVDDIALKPEDFFAYGEQFKELVNEIVRIHEFHNRIFIAGNGGLASEAEHFAAELVGTYGFHIYIPCKALSENSAIVTALANDLGFENVFSHQLKVWGKPSDLFIGLTTSCSDNIVRALRQARELYMRTAVICSQKPYEFDSDYIYRLPGIDVAQVQEYTIKFLHKLAYESKKIIFDIKSTNINVMERINGKQTTKSPTKT